MHIFCLLEISMIICVPLESPSIRLFNVDLVQEPTVEQDQVSFGLKAFFNIKTFKNILSSMLCMMIIFILLIGLYQNQQF